MVNNILDNGKIIKEMEMDIGNLIKIRHIQDNGNKEQLLALVSIGNHKDLSIKDNF